MFDGDAVSVGEDVSVLVIEAVSDGDAPGESVWVGDAACVGVPVLDAGGAVDVGVPDAVEDAEKEPKTVFVLLCVK